jgi:hypothetical protein
MGEAGLSLAKDMPAEEVVRLLAEKMREVVNAIMIKMKYGGVTDFYCSDIHR